MNESKIAARFYRFRWLTSAVLVAVVGLMLSFGIGRIDGFGETLRGLGNTGDGSGHSAPLVFDPRLDIWFDESDPAVDTFYEIEDRFVAEDYVLVTFEENDEPLGAFSKKATDTVARLTQRLLRVPGVRHVRSLTANPWIRWGEISDADGNEQGLIIGDLFEGEAFDERARIERMIAVLGARRTAEKLGETAVREIIGEDADFGDHIGEPRLIGTVVNEGGTTTTVQVQVLRPIASTDDRLMATLHGAQFQRATLRGIVQVLALEKGLIRPTPQRAELAAWIGSLPKGERRSALEVELVDPRRNWMANADGERVQKFERVDDTKPAALSEYDFKLGGVPLFEKNFEDVGMGDAKYIPLMFLVIIIALVFVFRHAIGVIAPLVVVFGAILAMVGVSFWRGSLFNNLTMIAPNMLTAVGVADAIHLVASWALLRGRYDNRRQLVEAVIAKNWLPVLLTSVTTAVGFYSLTVSTLYPVRELGLSAGLGTIFAYLLSMTVVPALLSLVPHKKRATARKSSVSGWFGPARSAALARTFVRRRGVIAIGTLVVAAVAIFGTTRILLDTDFRGMFPESNKVMSDFRWIENRLGGVGDLEIVFDGARDGEDAPELSGAEESQLAGLRLRRDLSARADVDATTIQEAGGALSKAEQDRLAQLEAKEERWNRPRIGVDPQFLASLDRFERRLRSEMADRSSKLHVVTDLMSPLDVLRKMHQVQHENRASFYRVPHEADVAESSKAPRLEFDEVLEEWSRTPAQSASTLVAQYYLQYENGAKPGDNLATELSADRTQFRMQGRVAQAPSFVHAAAFDRIREIASTEFPQLADHLAAVGAKKSSERRGVGSGGAAAAIAIAKPGLSGEANSADSPDRPATATASEMTLSGKTLLYARTTDVFSRGFVQSMAIALAAITLLIGVIFRSVRLALISIVPNLLPILLPLSFFGIFGIPLDGPAVVVSSVALGVGVDDTIHFLTKFVRARRLGKSVEEAIAFVYQEAGTAITVTTLVLVIGFATLALSSFTPNVRMGQLAVVMIALAWLADVVVVPALLSLFFSDAETVAAVGEAETSDKPALQEAVTA